MADEIRDNPARSRFEMDAGDGIAFVNYRLTPGMIVLSHTEVPEQLEGQGLSSKVVPACGFVAAFIRKNPEFRPLLVQTNVETR